jgi:hypothetical protein
MYGEDIGKKYLPLTIVMLIIPFKSWLLTGSVSKVVSTFGNMYHCTTYEENLLLCEIVIFTRISGHLILVGTR